MGRGGGFTLPLTSPNIKEDTPKPQYFKVACLAFFLLCVRAGILCAWISKEQAAAVGVANLPLAG